MWGDHNQAPNGPNTNSSEEIFFIPSSDGEDSEETHIPFQESQQMQGGMKSRNAFTEDVFNVPGIRIENDTGFSPSDTPSSSPYYSPTVNNVLFWEPDPRGAEEALKASSSLTMDRLTNGKESNDCPPAGLEKGVYPYLEDFWCYAGGSPVAMPKPKPLSPPLPLDELLRMSTVEVRNRLEPFFSIKENNFVDFQYAERQEAPGNDDGDAKSNLQGNDPPDLENEMMWRHLRRQDRRVRIVNISNWRNDDDEGMADDVLLPATLVPKSSYYHRPSALSPPPNTTPPQTLREHQIGGIRFLWSILVEGPVGQVPSVGCILAHTMGLGKTAQVVTFTHLFATSFGGVTANRARFEEPLTRPSSRPRVLIVAPKSTLPAWSAEFTTWSAYFPAAQRLTPMVIDSGSSRLPQRLQTFQHWRRDGGVLLAGYEALSRIVDVVGEEHLKSDEDPFTDLIVCDEAHRLKSAHLKIVAALSSLHPLRRLLLTGTPLQNHLDEYWAMVNFAMCRYLDRQHFNNYFVNPIESSVNHSASKREVDLARKAIFALTNETKHFIQRVDCTPLKEELPPLHEYVLVVPMTDLQREYYQRFLQVVLKNRGNDFRLLPAVSLSGKIAAHPQLAFDLFGREKELRSQKLAQSQAAGRDAYATDLPDSTAGRKQTHAGSDKLSIAGSPRAEDNDDLLTREDSVEYLYSTTNTLYERLSYARFCKPPPGYVLRLEDGSKIHVALCIILAAMRLGEKCLLFSLSTRLLDLFEVFIEQVNERGMEVPDPDPPLVGRREGSTSRRCICYCRLDGSHSTAQRDAMITAFNTAHETDLFLMSMKAGGVGITLPAATRVLLLDTSFNPSDDRQAIGRAYRYGQTRPVHVYRLLCDHALEVSLFRHKLAKEWLFRTVVESAAVRRDGLRGLRLHELLSGLRRTARELRRTSGPPGVSQKPSTHTRSGGPNASQKEAQTGQGRPVGPPQDAQTRRLMAADPVLAAVAPLLLEVRPYAMYLTPDEAANPGEDDARFYQRYLEAHGRTVGEVAVGRGNPPSAPSPSPQPTGTPDRTFIGLVDDIIRSRVGTNSHLQGLLHAMGLRVDSTTGTVQKVTQEAEFGPPTRGELAEMDTHARERNSDLNGRSDDPQSGDSNRRASGSQADYSLVGVVPPRYQRQRVEGRSETVPLLYSASDEDEGTVTHTLSNDEDKNPQSRGENVLGGTHDGNQQEQRLGTRRKELRAIDPSMYAPFRPGSSPHLAIDIDED